MYAIAEDEYDSDSLKFDIGYVGNILNHISDEKFSNSIKNLFVALQSMSLYLI